MSRLRAPFAEASKKKLIVQFKENKLIRYIHGNLPGHDVHLIAVSLNHENKIYKIFYFRGFGLPFSGFRWYSIYFKLSSPAKKICPFIITRHIEKSIRLLVNHGCDCKILKLLVRRESTPFSWNYRQMLKYAVLSTPITQNCKKNSLCAICGLQVLWMCMSRSEGVLRTRTTHTHTRKKKLLAHK